MNCFCITLALVFFCSITASTAKVTLLIEVSQQNIKGEDIQAFLNRAIRSANTGSVFNAHVSDLNECESDNFNTCSEFADCTNLNGSYSCECRPGFIDTSVNSRGQNCSDIDECATGAAECSENAICTNTNGSYGCACMTGFTGDGRTCADIDECDDDTCSSNAMCTNSVGSYVCSCMKGFTGDGVTCSEVTREVQSTLSPTTTTSEIVTTQTKAITSTSDKAAYLSTNAITNLREDSNDTTVTSSADASDVFTTIAPTTRGHGATSRTDGIKSTSTALTTTEQQASTDGTKNPNAMSSTNDLSTSKLIITHQPTTVSTKVSTAAVTTDGTTNGTTNREKDSNRDTTSMTSTDITVESTATTSSVVSTASNETFTTTGEQFTHSNTQASSATVVVPTEDSTTKTADPTDKQVQTNGDTNSTTTTASTHNNADTNTSLARTESTTPHDFAAKTSNSALSTEFRATSTEATTTDWTSGRVKTPRETTTAESITTSNTKVTTETTILDFGSGNTTFPVQVSTAGGDVGATTTGNSLPTKISEVSTSSQLNISSSFTPTALPTEQILSSTDIPLIRPLESTTNDVTMNTAGPGSSQNTRTTTTASWTSEINMTATMPESNSQSLEFSSTALQTSTDDQISTLPPHVKTPSYTGNRTEYLAAFEKIVADLKENSNQRLDINDAGSTIANLENIISGGIDKHLVDTSADIVNAFSDASIVNGEVVLDAGNSAKMTRFLSAVLENMPLPEGRYTKVGDNLVMEAQDVNFNDTDEVTFEPSGGAIMLPQAFVQSAAESMTRQSQPTNTQRLAFTQYSDSRFFSTNSTSFVMSGREVKSSTFPEKSSIINTPIMGASVAGKSITNAAEQAIITMNLLITESVETNYENGTKEVVSFTGNPRCVWWDYDLLDWAEAGCVLETFSNATVTCKCNHLTSFAVLMTVEKTVEDEILNYLSYVGAALSIAGLVGTIITYSIFSTLRKSRSKKILLHFCVALCGVYITYLLGIATNLPANPSQCVASGFFMHFFTLAVMAWMSVEVFDMYIMFVRIMHISIHKYLLKASLIAWLAPLVAAIIPLGVHLSLPYKDIYPIFHEGTTVCWLGQTGMLYAFIIPSAIILATNLVLFTVVLYHVTCKRNQSLVGRIGRRSGKHNIKATQHIINALALLLLAGPTWIVGYLINVQPVEDGVLRRVLSYIFVILNAFQGFWIFIVFCIRPPAVRNKWTNLICRGQWDDHTAIYISSSSQRNTTKVTSMSPRTSIYPESSVVEESHRSAGDRKASNAYIPSLQSSNSNNSNGKASRNSSITPLTIYHAHNRQLLYASVGSPASSVESRLSINNRGSPSQYMSETESIADSELNPVVKM